MIAQHIVKPGCPAPIGWLGGKTKLRGTIINCMPKHECYVEVFAGSATVFFGKPPSRNEIINDINLDLVHLMRVLAGMHGQAVYDEFVGYVRKMPASRAAYDEWKNIDLQKRDDLSIAQKAFIYYYTIKKGFSSVRGGGYEASPFSSSRYNMKTDFEQFWDRFQAHNAQIENLDFVTLITKYNRDRADTLFFLDPPYFIADGTNYYEFVFDAEKHQQLRQCCDEIHKNKNKFLITYDDCKEVIDLYQPFHIYRTDELTYSASDESEERSLKKTELFVSNYDIGAVVRECNSNKAGAPGKGDIFEEVNEKDDRIEFPGNVGLTKIN